jgi:hypothetical protein
VGRIDRAAACQVDIAHTYSSGLPPGWTRWSVIDGLGSMPPLLMYGHRV